MRRTMPIRISGGPFDGGTIEAPRRTRPGLSLVLVSDDARGEYLLTARDGGVAAVHVTDAAAHGVRSRTIIAVR